MQYSLEPDEVMIAVPLHDLDHAALVRAALATGVTRNDLVKQAIADKLLEIQKQGIDLGIVTEEAKE
ncbi:hypothetical protein ES703_112989 [subsurface metagenome]